MKLHAPFFAIILLLSACSKNTSYSKTTGAQLNATPEKVMQISHQFHQTMVICPEKIWSDYSWNTLKVVYVYPSLDRSWVWDASKNTIEPIENASLNESVMGSTYDFFELDGQQTMSLNMEEDIDAFEFGTHEFFHAHGQKDWMAENASNGRGTEYPLQWQPRFYRRMVMENLKKYFKTNESDHLSHAKYWFEKWSTEYPGEVEMTADGYEGTANYVENMAKAIATTGCNATDETIRATLISRLETNYQFPAEARFLGLDVESYPLGGLAAVILRFSNHNLKEWNSAMSGDQTPLQVLFADVESKSEPDHLDLVGDYTKLTQESNATKGELLDQSIANWMNKDFIRVPLPYAWLQSNLSPLFFSQTKIGTETIQLYPLYNDHLFQAQDGLQFTAQAHTVVFKHDSEACPGQFSYALIPASGLNLDGKKATLISDTLNGMVMAEIKKNDQGYTYLCPAATLE